MITGSDDVMITGSDDVVDFDCDLDYGNGNIRNININIDNDNNSNSNVSVNSNRGAGGACSSSSSSAEKEGKTNKQTNASKGKSKPPQEQSQQQQQQQQQLMQGLKMSHWGPYRVQRYAHLPLSSRYSLSPATPLMPINDKVNQGSDSNGYGCGYGYSPFSFFANKRVVSLCPSPSLTKFQMAITLLRYYSILVVSYSLLIGALDSSALHIPYSAITYSIAHNHHTNIDLLLKNTNQIVCRTL